MTVTVHGTYLSADDGTPAQGAVDFRPDIAAVHDTDTPAHLVTRATVRGTLDDTGTFTVELIPSDDPGWRTDNPMPYRVTVGVTGHSQQFTVLIPADLDPVDLNDLLPLTETPGIGVLPVPGPPGPVGPAGPAGPPGAGVDGSGNLNAPGWIRAGTKPAAVNDVPRLARVPNPLTGDLGLPGFLGSDTGVRNIQPLLANGWAVTEAFFLQRIGNVVFLLALVDATAATSDTVATLPPGFQPVNRTTIPVTNGFAPGVAEVRVGGDIYILRSQPVMGAYVRAAGSFITSSGWPSSLPGTQITPPAVWP